VRGVRAFYALLPPPNQGQSPNGPSHGIVIIAIANARDAPRVPDVEVEDWSACPLTKERNGWRTCAASS
jgi:hypothetical protein